MCEHLSVSLLTAKDFEGPPDTAAAACPMGLTKSIMLYNMRNFTYTFFESIK
jgi:hypothetical protein